MPPEPLALTRLQAATLCGLKPSGFDAWVRRGVVPGPIPGTRRWSRAALERALGGETPAAVVDDGRSHFEREMAQHGRGQSRDGRVTIEEMKQQWRADPHEGPLGQREKAVLSFILAAGEKTLDHAEVPFGLATHLKLAARGYLVTDGPNLYEFKLTPAGRKAAELLVSKALVG